ncbi:hypothetical protein BD408DRAFT_346902, partial [Parasitella parasitica]
FARLRRELEIAAKKKGNMAIVDVIHTHISDAPMELSKTIKSIMNSQNITPGDLVALKRFYASENPPAARHLCDYDLIIKMLAALYVPQHGSLLRQDLVDDVTFLIAYATTMNDTKPRTEQQGEIHKVQSILKDLYISLVNKTEVSVTGAMKYIIMIQECIKHKTDTFAPEIQLALQRTWVDRMLYLVQLNYTIPVLKYFSGPGRDLDDSLIVHFVKKLLKMAQAPYSVLFIRYTVAIIEPLVENLVLIKDVQQLVVNFLGMFVSKFFLKFC